MKSKKKTSKYSNQNMITMVIVGIVAVLGLAFLLLLVSGNDDRQSVPAAPNVETTKETSTTQETTTQALEKGVTGHAQDLFNAKVENIEDDDVAVARLVSVMNIDKAMNVKLPISLKKEKGTHFMCITLDKIVTEEERPELDEEMQKYAQQMLALVVDADEVQWFYKVRGADGQVAKVNASLNASATTPLVKTDIKAFGNSAKQVQKLLDLQGGAF